MKCRPLAATRVAKMITHESSVRRISASMNEIAYYAPDEETLNREGLAALQRRKLSAMWPSLLASPFYRRKLAGIDFDPSRDSIDKLPITTRPELERDQAENPPYGTILAKPIDAYNRIHQTSGSLCSLFQRSGIIKLRITIYRSSVVRIVSIELRAYRI